MFLRFIFGFLKSLFSAARPGLDRFLKTNLDYAKALIREEYQSISAEGFHEVKQRLFLVLQARFPGIPGTFISLLLDFAFEHVKAAADKQIGRL